MTVYVEKLWHYWTSKYHVVFFKLSLRHFYVSSECKTSCPPFIIWIYWKRTKILRSLLYFVMFLEAFSGQSTKATYTLNTFGILIISVKMYVSSLSLWQVNLSNWNISTMKIPCQLPWIHRKQRRGFCYVQVCMESYNKRFKKG